MAESILKLVLEKLGDVFVKEVLHLYGVSKQMEKVRYELSWIQAFLKDADRKRIVDERQKKWLKEVKDLAYWIEDVVDSFLLEVPEQKPGKKEAVKRLFMKVKKLPSNHNLGDEINKIEARIREINESRVRYGITSLGEGIEEEIRQPVRRIVLPDVEDASIVGFEADIERIVSLLLVANIERRSVISIVGTGGLGKTTLAHKVYNSEAVKTQFDIRLWVTVSQKFELIDALRNIAEQLQIEPPRDLSEHHLGKLYQSLTKKRYLLVLDDIWTTNLWTQIEGIFPNANSGSRILITTRFLNIAEQADPTSVPYRLQFLTEKPSLELLLKKALPNRKVDEGYPDDLYSIGKQFAKRCGGLPLALVVLGGLLSKKIANYVEWNRVMETMDWGVDGEECNAVIGTSYDDLPFALKSCFMYFSIFPEDGKIDASSLLRMWIAEGFIPQEENKTPEDTAERFLEDLAQRCMIQVSTRTFDGSIKTCHVHDLLLGLAIKKAKDDNFLLVCSKIDDVQNCSQTRRLAIHESLQYPNVTEIRELYGKSIVSATPNLRSLLSSGLMPKVSQLMHLKVLYSRGWSRIDHIYEPENCRRLSQLRYLKLTLFVESNKEIQDFQRFISGMPFLQTLDLQNGEIHGGLPDCIWHVKTLRHVMLPPESLISGPPPSVDITNLQTLVGVTSRESWKAVGLPKIPNLRILIIRLLEIQFQWDPMVTLLETLEHLISLSIFGDMDDIGLNIVDMRNFPFYHRLQNLKLWNIYDYSDNRIALDVGMFPLYLTTLHLRGIKFWEDPIPVLEKLENLKMLYLNDSAIQQLCCSAGGLGQLEELEFTRMEELGEWIIEEGAMPMLKKLKVTGYNLRCVPIGLEHLTVLQELMWHPWNPQCKITETMKNAILSMCKHVPSIMIF
ncbi:Disease resistance protein (CC-NBS-LRR class) family [Rhynchospora pubera]|uniref:Disease resistance protein (CC-NBS-LRR class) family n=1 Tax=Rhynchospora pubera TaxID=906938 RepID=A0AAV8H9L5_9POAL|nr:Disease resistance protein (CC-NBS-LRR class) family [Rhynchospora pubera]